MPQHPDIHKMMERLIAASVTYWAGSYAGKHNVYTGHSINARIVSEHASDLEAHNAMRRMNVLAVLQEPIAMLVALEREMRESARTLRLTSARLSDLGDEADEADAQRCNGRAIAHEQDADDLAQIIRGLQGIDVIAPQDREG